MGCWEYNVLYQSTYCTRVLYCTRRLNIRFWDKLVLLNICICIQIKTTLIDKERLLTELQKNLELTSKKIIVWKQRLLQATKFHWHYVFDYMLLLFLILLLPFSADTGAAHRRASGRSWEHTPFLWQHGRFGLKTTNATNWYTRGTCLFTQSGDRAGGDSHEQ